MARIALEHIGVVTARAVRFRITVKVSLLGMHGVAIRAGNSLMSFGCRQIVRIYRLAVRIGEGCNRRRLLGKLALVVATEAHLARHLGLFQAGRLTIVRTRTVMKLWQAFRCRNGNRRTKAMRASTPCMPYRPQTRPRWNGTSRSRCSATSRSALCFPLQPNRTYPQYHSSEQVGSHTRPAPKSTSRPLRHTLRAPSFCVCFESNYPFLPPFFGFVEYAKKRTPQSAAANHPKQMNYVCPVHESSVTEYLSRKGKRSAKNLLFCHWGNRDSSVRARERDARKRECERTHGQCAFRIAHGGEFK